MLPTWTSDLTKEAEYLEAAAEDLGATVLDRDLMHTQFHRRGIEPCDLITEDGLPIHVKNVDRSTAASHLFAQALVATDALHFDEEARQMLRAKIRDAGGDPLWLPDRPDAVVLGIARPKALTAKDLFTFSQVTLARLDAVLANVGVTVYVAPILRHRGANQ